MHYKTIWISDVHIGSKSSSVNNLLEFMKSNESDVLYLVGDIIDGWALTRKFYWNQDCNDFLQKVLRKARKGTQVNYIPGNHDESARQFVGLNFENISVKQNDIYVTSLGKKMLILHGDEFDFVMQNHKWLAMFGSMIYEFGMTTSHLVNKIRSFFGLEYWSFVDYCKKHVKNAVKFINNFEDLVLDHAKQEQMDLIVCGHIHYPTIKEKDNIIYLNCGDWITNCSAIVETYSGDLIIIKFKDNLVIPLYVIPAGTNSILSGLEAETYFSTIEG
jgi:UDP-2,3-diacylglucosamine pyrophosphatase LpxH